MSRYSKAENELWNRLQNGERFGRYTTGTNPAMSEPFFWCELSVCGFFNEYIEWRNYGSSANKNTKSNLHWILTVIFKTTAEQFLAEKVAVK